MIDDARRLLHEAILLAFHPVEVVGAHVFRHGVVDVVRPHDGDGFVLPCLRARYKKYRGAKKYSGQWVVCYGEEMGRGKAFL